ncbi:unnamed protein product [Amoebophrya sp. A25]|nr:unnamed protein product [Amoebophrya sp. A25]|eukprot:GSA25T00022121001.1
MSALLQGFQKACKNEGAGKTEDLDHGGQGCRGHIADYPGGEITGFLPSASFNLGTSMMIGDDGAKNGPSSLEFGDPDLELGCREDEAKEKAAKVSYLAHYGSCDVDGAMPMARDDIGDHEGKEGTAGLGFGSSVEDLGSPVGNKGAAAVSTDRMAVPKLPSYAARDFDAGRGMRGGALSGVRGRLLVAFLGSLFALVLSAALLLVLLPLVISPEDARRRGSSYNLFNHFYGEGDSSATSFSSVLEMGSEARKLTPLPRRITSNAALDAFLAEKFQEGKEGALVSKYVLADQYKGLTDGTQDGERITLPKPWAVTGEEEFRVLPQGRKVNLENLGTEGEKKFPNIHALDAETLQEAQGLFLNLRRQQYIEKTKEQQQGEGGAPFIAARCCGPSLSSGSGPNAEEMAWAQIERSEEDNRFCRFIGHGRKAVIQDGKDQAVTPREREVGSLDHKKFAVEIKKSCWAVVIDGDHLRSDGFSAVIPFLMKEGVTVFSVKKWTDHLHGLIPYLYFQSFEVPNDEAKNGSGNPNEYTFKLQKTKGAGLADLFDTEEAWGKAVKNFHYVMISPALEKEVENIFSERFDDWRTKIHEKAGRALLPGLELSSTEENKVMYTYAGVSIDESPPFAVKGTAVQRISQPKRVISFGLFKMLFWDVMLCSKISEDHNGNAGALVMQTDAGCVAHETTLYTNFLRKDFKKLQNLLPLFQKIGEASGGVFKFHEMQFSP